MEWLWKLQQYEVYQEPVLSCGRGAVLALHTDKGMGGKRAAPG